MDGEVLIFNPATTTTVYLNETAKIVWDLCESLSVEEMIRALQLQYPEQADNIADDVSAAINELHEQQILVRCNA